MSNVFNIAGCNDPCWATLFMKRQVQAVINICVGPERDNGSYTLYVSFIATDEAITGYEKALLYSFMLDEDLFGCVYLKHRTKGVAPITDWTGPIESLADQSNVVSKLIDIHSQNWPEDASIIREWRKLLNEYNESPTRNCVFTLR